MDRVDDITDILLDIKRERDRIIKRLNHVLSEIKNIAKSYDKNSKILLFGSAYKQELKSDSDIDIIIISEKSVDHNFRMELLRKIYSVLGGEGIIQLHIITSEEFERWYIKFIKDDYMEI